MHYNPPKSSVEFSLQWTHKKGRLKQQQFWIYCEDKQHNYCQVSLHIDNVKAGPGCRLAMFTGTPQHYVVFPEFNEKAKEQAGVHLAERVINYYRTEFLKIIPWEELDIRMGLAADNGRPLYHAQGAATDVTIVDEGYGRPHPVLPRPLSFQYQWVFKNRQTGWFRVTSSLFHKGTRLVTGQSDLFMFNNPRMTSKKYLQGFLATEIKFMQCYMACQGGRPDIVRYYEAFTGGDGLTGPNWVTLADALAIDGRKVGFLIDKASMAFPKPTTAPRSQSLQGTGAFQGRPQPQRHRSTPEVFPAANADVVMMEAPPSPFLHRPRSPRQDEPLSSAWASMAQPPAAVEMEPPVTAGDLVWQNFPLTQELYAPILSEPLPPYDDSEFQVLLDGHDVDLDENMIAWLLPDESLYNPSGSSTDSSPRDEGSN